MRVGMNESRMKYLFGKSLNKLFADFFKIESCFFKLFGIAYFYSINKFRRKNALKYKSWK